MSRRQSTDAIREKARAWVLRLKDAHGTADRDAFQQWLAEDPAHQVAYDQVATSYDASGVLRASEIGRRRDLGAVFSTRNRTLRRGIAIASIAAFALIGGYELEYELPGLQPVVLERVMLSSGANARDVTLSDGSKLSMAPASEVRIELGRAKRLAEIRKGHVRLRVAREARPFRIVAGASSKEASTGVFDAAMVEGQGTVSAAAVSTNDKAKLEPDRVEVAAHAPQAVRQTIEFNAEPLRHAIDRINQAGAGRRIEIDPSLDNLRVTGAVQRGDSETIARSLALAFGLQITPTASGALLITREK